MPDIKIKKTPQSNKSLFQPGSAAGRLCTNTDHGEKQRTRPGSRQFLSSTSSSPPYFKLVLLKIGRRGFLYPLLFRFHKIIDDKKINLFQKESFFLLLLFEKGVLLLERMEWHTMHDLNWLSDLTTRSQVRVSLYRPTK